MLRPNSSYDNLEARHKSWILFQMSRLGEYPNDNILKPLCSEFDRRFPGLRFKMSLLLLREVYGRALSSAKPKTTRRRLQVAC